VLQNALRRRIHPDAHSTQAWHFDRHNFVGCGLNDWELLVAVALSSGTTFTLQNQTVVFQAISR
jgi:hypothetical protein